VNRTVRHAIPNALSLSRLLLGVTFPFLPTDWRLAVIVIAAVTDLLDGLAARWLRAESETGRMLDPVADKVFVLVLAGTLVAEGALHPLWWLGIAARDVVVLVGVAAVLLRRRWRQAREMRPSWLGKCTTAAQFAVLVALAAWNTAPPWLLTPTVLLSVAAAADYARRPAAVAAPR
jgi:phosphatidylglycerophosphate synthase